MSTGRVSSRSTPADYPSSSRPMSPTGGDSGIELVAITASAEREAARLRDRLAEIEVEQATLEAELAVFNADYMRVVMTVLLDVQELEARILALLATRSGADD